MSDQYLRYCSLVIGNDSQAFELAGLEGTNQVLRIRFAVNYQTIQTPTTLNARVYNLSTTTVNKIIALVGANPATISSVPSPTTALVILQAGYIHTPGDQTIFRGQIYQMRVGKENATDTYLDIFAADGDYAHTYSITNKTLPAGWTPTAQWAAHTEAMSPQGIDPGTTPKGLSTNGASRGKVLFGKTSALLQQLANSNNFFYNILHGKLEGVAQGAARVDQAIEINSKTGMINIPQQTENGITVTMLMNARITWGTKVRINESDIAHFTNANQTTGFTRSSDGSIQGTTVLVPSINTDGDYIVLNAIHEGDTRSNSPWFTTAVCISSNPSAKPPLSTNGVPLPPGVKGGALPTQDGVS